MDTPTRREGRVDARGVVGLRGRVGREGPVGVVGLVGSFEHHPSPKSVVMRSVSSVRTQKDGIRYTKVLVHSSGSEIVFRTSHGDVQRMHETLTRLLLDHDDAKHAPAVHAPPAPVAHASVADELRKLAELRDAPPKLAPLGIALAGGVVCAGIGMVVAMVVKREEFRSLQPKDENTL